MFRPAGDIVGDLREGRMYSVDDMHGRFFDTVHGRKLNESKGQKFGGSLYSNVANRGVETPVVHQVEHSGYMDPDDDYYPVPGTSGVVDMGKPMKMGDGHHRVVAQNDINPSAEVPVIYSNDPGAREFRDPPEDY
jgi:hypothetical protein